MPEQRFRVGGSGFTAFAYAGRPLLYVQQVTDTAPRAVADPAPIHPLDEPHPIEVAFPRAHGMGTLAVQIIDQWASEVWEQLPGFEGAVDLIEVFTRNVQNGSVTVSKVVRSPSGGVKSIFYHNTVITNIDEGETIQIGTMLLPKTITMQYTHRTRI